MAKTYILFLVLICIGVWLEVVLLGRLLDAFYYSEIGKDFPEYELWGRDWFDADDADEKDDEWYD